MHFFKLFNIVVCSELARMRRILNWFEYEELLYQRFFSIPWNWFWFVFLSLLVRNPWLYTSQMFDRRRGLFEYYFFKWSMIGLTVPFLQAIIFMADSKENYWWDLRIERFNWFKAITVNNCHYIVQMGLGKTLQAISIAYYYKDTWPLLIVVPSSVKFSWIDEIEKWLPEVEPLDLNLIRSGCDVRFVSNEFFVWQEMS